MDGSGDAKTLVDSGSSNTFVDHSYAKKRRMYIMPKQRTIPLADKRLSAKIIGEVVINIEINGKEHRGVVAEVIENLCVDVIFGTDRLMKHRRVIFNYNGPEGDLIIGAIPEQPDTSQSTINNSESPPNASLPPGRVKPSQKFGTVNISPPPLFTNLSNIIHPIATKSCHQSPPDMKFMRDEVDKLHKLGVIQPSVSPWRAQAFVTKEDDNHRKRMVIDYSETINLFTELDAYPMPNILDMVQKMSQYKYFSTFDLKAAYHQVPIRKEDRKFTAFEVDGQLWEFAVIPFGVTNGVSAFQRTIDKVIQKEGLKDTFAFVDNLTVCGRTKEEHDENVQKFLKMLIKYNFTLNESKTINCATSITVLGYTVSYDRISPDQKRLRPLLDMPPPSTVKAQKRIVGMFSYYSKFISKF